jgi:glycosyltransferase involved in cell wall biosynthesis
MNKKLTATVLLSAYACCPGRGSEPGYGWNYLLQYAKVFEKVILVTSLQDHEAVREKLRELGIVNITLKVVRMRFGLDRLHYMPVGGIHLHYLLWLKEALAVIQSLPDRIDFAHHLTYGSLQFGSPLYKLDCPFIFGPVGGGQRTNTIFYPLMGAKARFFERVRNGVSSLFYRFSPFFKGTIRRASLIYCTNEETRAEARRFLPLRQHDKIKMMLDTSLDARFLTGDIVRPEKVARDGSHGGGRFSALWVGRLLPRKGVEILLNTVKHLKGENFHLTIAGDGPLREKVLAFIRDNGLEEQVNFVGYVDQRAILDYYRAADVLLFFSYRDSTGLQIMEAFSQGVPVISFDQFGASLLIQEEVGIKIPLEEDLAALQERIAGTLRELIREPGRAQVMGRNAAVYASRFSWEYRMETILQDSQPFLKKIKPFVYANADLRPERV